MPPTFVAGGTDVTRGAIVVAAARGAYTSKPRPALIVQADAFNATHSSITICPITTDCVDAPLFRITLPPGERTGLVAPSQVMVDKVVSVPRAAIVREVGRCDDTHLELVEDALRVWLGL
jgi:mRNA interferase MazF